MDNRSQYIVAIEIGSSKIVGAVAERTSSGYTNVKYLVDEPLQNCVRYGHIQNVESTKNCIQHMLKQLETRMSDNTRTECVIEHVYMGVSGRSIHSVATEVQRSIDAQNPITQQLIDRIVAEAADQPVKNYQTVDVVPRSFTVDNAVVPAPVGQYGSNIGIRLNQIVAKQQLMLNLDRVKPQGVEVTRIITPLAVGQTILTEEERTIGCMLVDIGAETTTVSIYKDKALTYLITLPLGGRNVTRDISNGLTVVEESAERVKKNINHPLDSNVPSMDIDGVDAAEAAKYISARTGEIIANINQQLEYAGYSSREIHSIVLLGGGSQLQGIAQKLEEVTKIKVRPGEVPTTLNLLDQNINRPRYIQLFSMLAHVAELPMAVNCVQMRTFENVELTVESQQPAAKDTVDEEKKREKEKRDKKPTMLTKWKQKFDQLFNENDDYM